MTLNDKLRQDQVNKFQVNSGSWLNKNFLNKIILENNEGILYLDHTLSDSEVQLIYEHLCKNYKNYAVDVDYDVTNYEIGFKKKEEKN
jgi:hypothetical protein